MGKMGKLVLDMKKSKMLQLSVSMKSAQRQISKLTPKEKSALEKKWDVEHAYYSSVLEGSKLDREEFEKLGEKVA